MKTTLTLIAALLIAQLQAKQPDLPMQDLLDHAKYSEVIQKAPAEPDYLTNPRLLESQATAMYLAGQHEDADKLLTDALAKFHKTRFAPSRGDEQVQLAQQASLFSAGGLAKDGRDLLKKAVELSPDEPKVVLDLIGFYVQAPSIAGGDKDAAVALVPTLQAKDPNLAGYCPNHVDAGR